MVGHGEGISYLLLLGLAMPMKYFFDMPLAVSIVGSIHGFLFVWFSFVLLWLFLKKEISFSKAALAVLLSFIPFGTFYLDRFVFSR